MSGLKIVIKVLMDPTGKKILYAEARKDFVDLIFGILALPVGLATRLLSLGDGEMVGCLGNLYQSIRNLDSEYMLQPDHGKKPLLNPHVPICGAQDSFLVPKNPSPTARNVYKCVNYDSDDHSGCRAYVADDPRCVCPCCNNLMGRKGSYVALPPLGVQGGYVRGGLVTYMIMDDLKVKPLSTTAISCLLRQFNVKDLGECMLQSTVVGVEEALELLRASLQSKTVLSDVLLPLK